MLQIIIEGLMLGLSSGVYCLSACLVFFMPYLITEGEARYLENFKKISVFLCGRLIAYIAFALIIGWLGAGKPDALTAKLSHISLIAVSSLMVAYALARNFPDAKSCQFIVKRFKLAHMPFFLGLFTGLNPCLPFIAGAARLWTLHSVFLGVVLFTAFFAGTSLYVVPLVFVARINRFERVKQIAAMVTLLCGLWFLFIGISGLLR